MKFYDIFNDIYLDVDKESWLALFKEHFNRLINERNSLGDIQFLGKLIKYLNENLQGFNKDAFSEAYNKLKNSINVLEEDAKKRKSLNLNSNDIERLSEDFYRLYNAISLYLEKTRQEELYRFSFKSLIFLNVPKSNAYKLPTYQERFNALQRTFDNKFAVTLTKIEVGLNTCNVRVDIKVDKDLDKLPDVSDALKRELDELERTLCPKKVISL